MSEPKRLRIGGAEVEVSVSDDVRRAAQQVWRQAVGGRGPRGQRQASRKPRERLGVDRIVDVALAQMRESGYDAVTMRSVARELGTGPASLYAHVANRQELDALVLDRVNSRLRVPEPDPDHWSEQLRAVGVDLHALYAEHPGVARASMGMIPLQAGALVVTERLLAIMRAGGVADRHAAWFVDAYMLYIGAVAVEEDIWRTRARDGDGLPEHAVVAQVRTAFAALPADTFPLIASMAATLTDGSDQDRFGFGLDLMLAGLRALTVATPDRER